MSSFATACMLPVIFLFLIGYFLGGIVHTRVNKKLLNETSWTWHNPHEEQVDFFLAALFMDDT